MAPRNTSAGSAGLLTFSEWSRIALPGATAALIVFTGSLVLAALPTVDAADAAEIRYLGRLALLVLLLLLPAAALGRSPGALAAWSAALVGSAALLWTLPPGPLRGAAISSLLVLVLVATVRSAGSHGGTLCSRSIPAALAVQFLALPGELLVLPLDGRSLARLFVLPIAASALALILARREGTMTAAIATVSALAIAGRFSTAVVVALLVPVVAPLLERPGAGVGRRLLGALVLIAPAVLDPVLGAMSLLGGLALLGRRGWPAALIVATGLLALGPVARSWIDAAALLPLLLLIAAPAVARSLGGERRSIADAAWRLAAPLALGWIGLRFGESATALTVPAVLLALGLGSTPGTPPHSQRHEKHEVAWPGLWLCGSLLAASYPWLRDPGAAAMIERLGLLRPPWLLLVLGLVVVAWFRAVTRRRARNATAPPQHELAEVAAPRDSERGAGRSGDRRRWPLAAALVSVLAVPLLRVEDAAFLLTWPSVELTRGQPAWTSEPIEIDGEEVAVVVDSALAFGAGVAAGDTLATVRWVPAVGGREPSVTIRQGFDSAEWTASDDAREGLEPWLSLVAPDGSRFVHRYRARREMVDVPAGAGRLVVELADDLPAEARLSLYRVTLVGRGLRAGPAPR